MSTPTLIATVGAADANSFGTRAEADTYHDSVLHTDVPWPANIAATATLGSGDNGVVTVTADEVGTEGNDLTIAAVLGVGLDVALSAAKVTNVITVTLGTNGSGTIDATKNTAVLVAGVITALADVSAVASGTGATAISVTATTSFTGGSYREDVKIPALIMAQQQMTELIVWTGFVADLVQKLPWPRNGMWGRNVMSSILSTVIPDEVKWAQFELARLLIATDRTEENEVVVNGITYLRAGPVTLKFKEYDNPGAPVIPMVVWSKLVPSWYSRIVGVVNTNRDLERA